jgi:hypothetical protein
MSQDQKFAQLPHDLKTPLKAVSGSDFGSLYRAVSSVCPNTWFFVVRAYEELVVLTFRLFH